MINGMPQPARFLFLAPKTPRFVHFVFADALEEDLDVAREQELDQGLVHRGERPLSAESSRKDWWEDPW